MVISPFHKARCAYQPRFPAALSDLSRLGLERVSVQSLAESPEQKASLAALFPKTWAQPLLRLGSTGDRLPEGKPQTVAVVLSGGPAPGGHNVIWGLLDGLRALSPASRLIGFRGGASGILDDQSLVIDPATIADYRNSGGFDLLGSGRTKIETPTQLDTCRKVLERHGIDVLVVIGGDDSNTNAALMAESFKRQGSAVRVLGIPKTIDGDLKNAFVETSFGFDTAVRVYSELISNISRDALSARKYYHFIRLMGRSASHITLECALQTQPNLTLLSEEVAARQLTLRQVVEEIGDCVKRRAAAGKNFGIVLIPEGVIEFIPEIKALIGELNHILAEHQDFIDSLSGFTEQVEFVHRKLGRDATYTFASLPIDIQRQLLMDRDPHGNVVVSRIETEKLLISLLEAYLKEEAADGRYRGKFGYQHHFLGYEGRCAAPSNFDADYAYSLGRCAVALVAAGVTGYMAVVERLAREHGAWQAAGVPLTAMMTLEWRHGRETPVIKKGLVELEGATMRHFAAQRSAWAAGEHYRFAGPIQYFGPPELCDKVPASLALEQGIFADGRTLTPTW